MDLIRTEIERDRHYQGQLFVETVPEAAYSDRFGYEGGASLVWEAYSGGEVRIDVRGRKALLELAEALTAAAGKCDEDY